MPQKNVDFVLIMCKDSFISPFELDRATQFWWELVFILAFGKPWQLLDCGPGLPGWHVEMIASTRPWGWPRWNPQPSESPWDQAGLGDGQGLTMPTSPWLFVELGSEKGIPRMLTMAPGNSAGFQLCHTTGGVLVRKDSKHGPRKLPFLLTCHLFGFNLTWIF